jgi:hypothetical protein
MAQTEFATLSSDEIAIAKAAIRVIRVGTAVGTAIAIPLAILFALPLLSYALVGAVVAAPAAIGYLLLTA